MDNISGTMASPLQDTNEIMVFTLTSVMGNKADFKAMFDLLKEKFGLVIMMSTQEVDSTEDAAQYDYTSVMDCVLNSVEHKILSKSDWFGFNVDGQQKGVLAKASTDDPTFAEVISMKGYTINSDGKLKCNPKKPY